MGRRLTTAAAHVPGFAHRPPRGGAWEGGRVEHSLAVNRASWDERAARRARGLTGLRRGVVRLRPQLARPGAAMVGLDFSAALVAQARALAEWEGEWIALNGLTEIDRGTARALFKWPGKRLSLNGFAEFPPGIARYLAKWKGKQLELMGLELLSHKTAVYFSEWKKAGGQLYIPNKFYRRK